MTEHAQLANSTDEGSAQVLPTGRPSVEAALTLASVRTCRRCLREGRPAVDDPSLDACRRCFSVLKGERITVGIDASIKNDNAAAVAVTRRGQQLALVGYRIWRPSKSDPLDIEATVEQQLIEWASRHRIVAAYYDPYQLHRSAVTLQRRGVRMLEYPQTPANLTRAGQNLSELIMGRNLRIYHAPDLRQHAINAVAIETTRGWKLAKEKMIHRSRIQNRSQCRQHWRNTPVVTSRDVFVHVTQLVGRDCLRRGDRVTFGLVPHARGPRAVDVELEDREH